MIGLIYLCKEDHFPYIWVHPDSRVKNRTLLNNSLKRFYWMLSCFNYRCLNYCSLNYYTWYPWDSSNNQLQTILFHVHFIFFVHLTTFHLNPKLPVKIVQMNIKIVPMNKKNLYTIFLFIWTIFKFKFDLKCSRTRSEIV